MDAIELKRKSFELYDVIYEIYNYSKKPVFMPNFEDACISKFEDFNNYEILLRVRISEGEYISQDFLISDIPGITPLKLNIPVYKPSYQEEITIGKLDSFGWSPYFEDLNTLLEYKLFYKNSKIDIDNGSLNEAENKIGKLIAKYKLTDENYKDVIIKNKNDIPNIIGINLPFLFEMECTRPSKGFIETDQNLFYKINEFASDILVGGVWSRLVNKIWDKDHEEIQQYNYNLEFQNEKPLSWQQIINSNAIELYADAILYYDGKKYEERIASLKPPFKSLISDEDRIFHLGPRDHYENDNADKIIKTIDAYPTENEKVNKATIVSKELEEIQSSSASMTTDKVIDKI